MKHYRNDEVMDDEAFPFRAFPAPVPASIEPHTHDFMELVFVVEGEGRHEIAGLPTNIAAGDVYLISPGVSHAYRVQRSVTVYNVIFDTELIRKEIDLLAGNDSFFGFFYVEPFLRRTNPMRPYLNLQRSDRVRLRQMIETLIEEDRARQSGYQMFIKAQLIQVLIFLSRCFAASERPLTLDGGDEAEMVRRICGFIELHRSQPLTLDQVSAMCGLGTTAFSAKFKKHTGQTFVEYRNRLRIEQACRDLRETSHKIVDIAMNAGFDDLSHFNRVFRSLTGLSPRRYRENAARGLPLDLRRRRPDHG